MPVARVRSRHPMAGSPTSRKYSPSASSVFLRASLVENLEPLEIVRSTSWASRAVVQRHLEAEIAMTPSLMGQLVALKTAPVNELKQKWRDLFHCEPPPYNRRFLESRLAYRLQELVLGGLANETVERLDAIADYGASLQL